MQHYNDYGQYVRDFCNTLSNSGIKNYIHYSYTCEVEILEDSITYKKGFYYPLVDFVRDDVYLYRINKD